MLRLGIISDTHVSRLEELPESVLRTLSRVDLIVHAGDFTERAVLEGLKVLGRVKAVCGNMDSGDLRRILPEKDVFVAGGKRIGLIHGSGGPSGIAQRIRASFAGVDIIVFGHSHQSLRQYVRGTLLFNPGPAKESFGLLTIDDTVRADILRV